MSKDLLFSKIYQLVILILVSVVHMIYFVHDFFENGFKVIV